MEEQVQETQGEEMDGGVDHQQIVVSGPGVWIRRSKSDICRITNHLMGNATSFRRTERVSRLSYFGIFVRDPELTRAIERKAGDPEAPTLILISNVEMLYAAR